LIVFSVPLLFCRESVIREIHRRQMWEHAVLTHIRHNRGELVNLLVSHLELDAAVARKYESLAIRILEERAFSPLDLTTAEAEERRQQIEQWQARLYKPLEEWCVGHKTPAQMGRCCILDQMADSPDPISDGSSSGSSIGIGSSSGGSDRSRMGDADLEELWREFPSATPAIPGLTAGAAAATNSERSPDATAAQECHVVMEPVAAAAAAQSAGPLSESKTGPDRAIDRVLQRVEEPLDSTVSSAPSPPTPVPPPLSGLPGPPPLVADTSEPRSPVWHCDPPTP
jgi:hypothetical protein